MQATVMTGRVAGATALRPSFVGLVRGELFKISRQRLTWVLGVLLAGVICLPFLVMYAAQGPRDLLAQAPLVYLYRDMGISLWVLRVFVGLFVILLTSRLIGMEYSGGTIRVLLARGVGRVQLLGAKLVAVTIVSALVLLAGMVLATADSMLVVLLKKGNLDALKALNATFWADSRLYLVTVLVSLGVSILMATAVTVVTRSLAGGMSLSLGFFPADNFATLILMIAQLLTQSDFWLLVSGDLLGPNLNMMPNVVLPASAAPALFRGGFMPLVPVTGGHTLLVAGIYGAIFAAVAFGLTWKRDVHE